MRLHLNAKKSFLLIGSTFILSAMLIFFSASCTAQNFRFGVIADVQYADKENAIGRYYRTSLQKLDEAVSELNKHSPDFVVQLGDVIDGYTDDQEQSLVDLNRVFGKLDRLSMPLYHVVGNHCLKAGEGPLKEKLQLERFYYDFTRPELKNWRFVVLNGNDAGYGVVSEEQLEWFESVLKGASNKNEKVIVFSHFAIHPEAAKRHRMSETEKLFELIHQHDVVFAWFSGHDHAGGYAYDNGIHHITFKGMVESPVNNAYSLLEFHEELVRLQGFGDQPSHDLIID